LSEPHHPDNRLPLEPWRLAFGIVRRDDTPPQETGPIMTTRAVPAWFAESRLVSAVEVAIAAFLVIGHNVFHVVPNEVPFLFVLGLASARLRDGDWAAIGFRRPTSWGRVVLFALAAAAVRILAGNLVIDPLTSLFWPPAKPPAGAESIVGNLPMALLSLLLVWTFAAFGEEIGYRGYLITRAADLGRRSTAAWWVGMILASVLFGFGHYYKGPAGIVDSGVAGLILGTAYLLSGRNLWVCILAHGFIDTFAVVVVYSGLAT
jgi:membrane protease YdiL (CAAX protease family)